LNGRRLNGLILKTSKKEKLISASGSVRLFPRKAMSTERLSATGSYTFGQFEKNAEELERLKMQATIALDIEKAVWSKAGLTSDMRVLDLACGPGFISCELARLVNKGDVTGVDISAELIATAHQAKASEKIENVMFQTGNLYELELPANRFDFVYARFVFQHLAKPQLALENILRVLKPGGILCILDIDDNWTSFSPASSTFIKFIRKTGAGQRRKGGNRLIGSQLYGLLNEAGFNNVSVGIRPLTTEDIGMRYFLGVAVLFRMEMLNRLQKLLALPQLRKIKAATEDPHSWGSLGIFVGTGTK
jgi:ubiquinone/menaquinone biosynthesis C-methylase UbiE